MNKELEEREDLITALELARDVLILAQRHFPKSIKNPDTFQLLNVLANTVEPAIAKARAH